MFGPPFVGLPRRMQETRAKLQTGRDLSGLADVLANRRQGAFVRLAHLDVRQQREVVPGPEPRQVSRQMARQRCRLWRLLGQLARIPGIREEADAFAGEDGVSAGRAPVSS